MTFKKESEATTARLNQQRKIYWDKIALHKIGDIWNTLKPCDVVGVRLWGIWIAIEFKLVHTSVEKTTYEKVLSKVQRQQIATLESYKRAGWMALIIAYSDKDDDFIIYDYR